MSAATRARALPLALLALALAACTTTATTPKGTLAGSQVETVRRGDLTFVINHGTDDATLSIEGTDLLGGAAASGRVLPPQGVAVVRE